MSICQHETTNNHIQGLDDLCVRFIINLPQEELASPGRICFQIEEAQWFYEDFIRPLDSRMPSMHLRKFCSLIFQHCPLLAQHSHYADAAYEEFLAYKTRVPVRGAIMLNHDMDSVVLVKGWKKGAKWSFPRGKINKDEKDLDCAIREVYEETGFDIQEAGLVPEDEENAKYIEMSLREQHMRLYVFRSVPMDTHFEPRTRKEISKISWYKLADLPTLKKEKQQINPNGEDALKGSNFYMVAPFIRQLKNWIKEQKRLDKQHNRPAPRKTVVLEEDTTEAEEELPYVEAPSADEGPFRFSNAEDPGHFNRLLSGLAGNSQRGDDEFANLPEVSTAHANTEDLAAELKRMLSVGGPVHASIHQPVPRSIPQEKEAMANPLLNMLRGPAQPPQGPTGFIPPHTPADQIMPTPPLALTPRHHHPLPPQFQGMLPPPNFPLQQGHGQPLQQPQHPQGPRPFPQQSFSFNDGFPPSGHSQHQAPVHAPQSFSARGHPVVQEMAPPAVAQAPKPYQQTGDAQFALSYPQYGQNSAIPAASRLPAPKLTSHALNLLNVFKSPAPQVAHPAHPIHFNRPSSSGLEVPETSLQQQAVPPPPRPVEFSSPELAQPQAQKPRNQHQDALLTLFRAASTAPAPHEENVGHPPQHKKEPVELSAQSSPHIGHIQKQPGNQHSVQPMHQVQHKLSMRRLPNLDTTSPKNIKHSPSLTSATVSGPLNAPDFATVRKNHKPAELGTGASPNTEAPPPQRNFQPTAILSRASPRQQQHQQHRMAPPPPSQTPPVPVHTVNGKTAMEAPRPFHPLSILKRQEEGMPGENEPKQPPPTLPGAVPLVPQSQMGHPPPMLPGAVPLVPKNQMGPPPPYQQQKQPAHQRINSFDRRDSAPEDQKQTLLGLFAAKPKIESNMPIASVQIQAPTAISVPNDQKQQLLNLFGPAKPVVTTSSQNQRPNSNFGSVPVSAFPGNGSGVNSPVSPLPTNALPTRTDVYNYAPTSAPTSAPNSVPLPNPSAGSGVSVMRSGLTGYGEGDSRSRISSITSIPGVEQGRLSRKGTATLAGNLDGGSGTQSPITPKDKNFLLDYLMGVAKSGDQNSNGGK
jgi:mRNA-decapping enzyme subunit 2